MKPYFHSYRIFLLIAVSFLFAHCQSDKKTVEGFEVNIRLPEDPDMLHPILSSTFLATEVEANIFSHMTGIDPHTLELIPILIEAVPEAQTVDTGKYAGMTKLDVRLRDEALWDNGDPITAHDVLFTLKTVFFPGVPAASWRSTLNIMYDMHIDPDDEKRFELYIKDKYFKTVMIATNYEVYPEYHYDPTQSLRKLTLHELITEPDKAQQKIDSDTSLSAFPSKYQSIQMIRTNISGSGPYRLAFWEDKLQLRLEKKDNWWGEPFTDKLPGFAAHPDAIIYKIIPDEQTAISAIKAGNIDVMANVPAADFKSMQSDSNFEDKFHFFQPVLNLYYFLSLNTKRPGLNERNVRQAIAHLVDMDNFINVLMEGMAIRTIGHVHPNSRYYRDDLTPIPYSLEKARALLEEAGWSDTNNNGTRDKLIDGKRVELKLVYLATRRPVGQQMALSLQENARKVGIDIQIKQNDFKEHLKTSIRNRNFDIVAAAKSLPAGVNDPYQTWHSSNDTPEGDNWSGYGDNYTDSLIQVIRTTSDPENRKKAYGDFQERIYKDQPFIFLLCPTERILVNNRFEAFESGLKPGYHPSYFKLNQ